MMIWAISSAQGFISIRFTPKGLSVRLLQMRICLRSRSASSIPPVAMTPSAPALEQAAANSPVAMLAMPPWIMGNSVPSSSLSFFIVLLLYRKEAQAISSTAPPQVRPPPKAVSSRRLPGPTRPCSTSSLRTSGTLAAAVLP